MGNQKGFTVIQAVVALGIMAVGMYQMASVIPHFMQLQSGLVARQDQLALTADLQTILSSKQLCTQALLNTPFDAAAAARPPEDKQGGLPFKFRINDENLESGVALNSYALAVVKFELVNAVLAGVDVSGANVYKAQLHTQFNPKQKTVGAARFKGRVVGTAFFSVMNGVINGCAGESPLDAMRVAEMCTSLGGVFNAGSGRCIFTSGACPAGQFVTGFDSNGQLICGAQAVHTVIAAQPAAPMPIWSSDTGEGGAW